MQKDLKYNCDILPETVAPLTQGVHDDTGQVSVNAEPFFSPHFYFCQYSCEYDW